MPFATACDEANLISPVWVASINNAPMAEAPVINPRLRERLIMPEITPRCSGAACFIKAVLLAT
ncbi:hypothetical protein D3C85_1893120 [compost metagenome]